jgi:hypothetical protein
LAKIDLHQQARNFINGWVFSVGVNLFAVAVMTSYLSLDLYDLRTYTLIDNFSSVTGVKTQQIIGPHYFSDFQNSAIWVRSATPYLPSLGAQIGLPPFGVFVWRLFSFQPIQIAFLLFTLTGLVLLFWLLWKLAIEWNNSERIQVLSIAMLFSTPLLVNLDRGNSALIAMSCFGLGLIILQRGNYSLIAFLFILTAISLKIYWLAPLLCLLLIQKLRTLSIRIIFGVFSVNAVLSFILKTDPIKAVQNILGSTQDQYGAHNYESLYGGIGLSQFFLNASRIWCSDMQVCGEKYQVVSIIVPLVWLAYTSYFVSRGNDLNPFKIVLLLTAIQVVPAISMPYTAIWTIPAAVILLGNLGKMQKTKIANLICFTSLLVPNLLLPFGGVESQIINWRTFTLVSLVTFFISFHRIIQTNNLMGQVSKC